MLKVVEEGPHDHAMPALALSTAEQANVFVEKVKASGFEFVRFELPDMAGLSRGKTIPVGHIAGYM